MYDLLVIGSGAAGFSASIYAGRYLLKTVLVKGNEWGGETATAATIENYPGYLAIDGFELMQKMEQQAKAIGVTLKDGEVTAIKRDEGGCFVATVGSEEIVAKSVILATGSKRKRLNMPNEKELAGKGISYCTTCDAPLYRGKVIAIVGGGDSALKGANLASDYAAKTLILVRRTQLRAEPSNIDRIKRKTNVEILYETQIQELVGSNALEKIILTKPYQGSTELVLGGLFVEIGAEPNNGLARSLGVDIDPAGYVDVDPLMKTNVTGFFAAGDIVNETEGFKQDIVAASQGSIAATSAYKYVDDHPNACELHARPAME